MLEIFGILGMALLGTVVVLAGGWCGWKMVTFVFERIS